MTQKEPHPSHVEKVDAISAGTAKPELTPDANLPGIYKNLRTLGATTEYKLYDLLLQRIEGGKPIDWESVSEEVMGGLKARQDWYKAVLIRMFEKQWIDTPAQPQSNAPVVQNQGANLINALAEDFYNGASKATISDQERDAWRVHLLSVLDPDLQSACVWYMEQIEEGQPHTPDDWFKFVTAQQEISGLEEERIKKQLLQAIEYLERNGFIEEDLDLYDMADEIDMMMNIEKVITKFVPGENEQQIESTLQKYRQDVEGGRGVDVRTVQIAILEKVRDGLSTAWSDVYASIKQDLDRIPMSEDRAKDKYLDAIEIFTNRKLISVAQTE